LIFPTTISPTWRPNTDTLRWAEDAIKTYHLATDLDFEIDHFRNYFVEKKTTSPDWNARFKTWMGNDIKEAIKNKVKSSAAVREAQKYAGIQRVPGAPAVGSK
jgi:hypothetical protein